MRGRDSQGSRGANGGGGRRALVCATLVWCLSPTAPAFAGFDARPLRAATISGVESHAPASPSRLWRDSAGRWVHQEARVFNVYLRARDPRLRYWLAREVAEWNRYTVLTVRLVPHSAWANVFAVEGHYGRGSVLAWSQTCRSCQSSFIHFNLDRLPLARRGRDSDRQLRAVTCHELGHVLGLWHGGGDCMSYSYERSYTPGVGAPNARLVNRAYRLVRTGLPPRLLAGTAG